MKTTHSIDQHAPDFSFTVSPDQAGRRVDLFLSEQIGGRSRSHMKKLIQDGFVLLNGRSAKPGQVLRAGDRIGVWLSYEESSDQLVPERLPLSVLHEDEDIVVVNKAPGMVVHPGAGNETGTLVHGLLARCPRLAPQGAPKRPGIVHRLDRDTSGALVVAKNEPAYLDLIEQFKHRKVQKEYVALVYGRMSDSKGVIRTCIDRHHKDRKKMAVVQGKGREAVSFWEIVASWEEVALVRVHIQTGRTHQIRVHFHHLHHPVVGDPVYGGGKRKAHSLRSKSLRDLLAAVDRQMLHAHRLGIRHPRTRAPLTFTAPLPADFEGLLMSLCERSGIEPPLL